MTWKDSGSKPLELRLEMESIEDTTMLLKGRRTTAFKFAILIFIFILFRPSGPFTTKAHALSVEEEKIRFEKEIKKREKKLTNFIENKVL